MDSKVIEDQERVPVARVGIVHVSENPMLIASAMLPITLCLRTTLPLGSIQPIATSGLKSGTYLGPTKWMQGLLCDAREGLSVFEMSIHYYAMFLELGCGYQTDILLKSHLNPIFPQCSLKSSSSLFIPLTRVVNARRESAGHGSAPGGRRFDRERGGNKRLRPTGGEEPTEERVWTKSWSDTVADSPFFTGMFNNSSRVEEEDYESEDEEELENDGIPSSGSWTRVLCGEISKHERAKVLTDGPWKIMDHYLTVQKWKPNFIAEEALIPSTTVWIHIPGPRMEYFDERVLVNIGKLVGSPLKVDCRTAWVTRGTGDKIKKKLQFDESYEVPAQGRHDTGGKSWLNSFVYVQPHGSKKEEFWLDMDRLGSNCDCLDRIIRFREQWNRCNLLNAGRTEMIDQFPNFQVSILPRYYSDHNPILLNMDLKKDSILEAIKYTSRVIITWKNEAIGNIFKWKRTLRNHLQVDRGSWKAIKLARGGTNISHLLFANDLMLFLEARGDQISEVQNCLAEFCQASGLEVNLQKSKKFISPNVNEGLATRIVQLSSISWTEDLGIYLGVPILHKRENAETFTPLVKKILKKLASWKGKVLSMAGRRTLIQAVTSAIPIHTMQTNILPAAICNRLDSINQNFVRRRRIGIHKTRVMNLALMAKNGWKMFQRKDLLWCKIFREKYLKQEMYMSIKKRENSSSTWRGILKVREVIKNGSKHQIRSDEQTDFWQDWWTGKHALVKEYPERENSQNEKVARFILENKQWDINNLQNMVSRDTIDQIRSTLISWLNHEREEDKIVWGHSKDGQFSVKSAFKDPYLMNSNGYAAAGGLIRDEEGNWIQGFMINIGKTTSTLAEVWGLRQGLLLAKEMGARNLVVETDAKWLAETLNKEKSEQVQREAILPDCEELRRGMDYRNKAHIEGRGVEEFASGRQVRDRNVKMLPRQQIHQQQRQNILESSIQYSNRDMAKYCNVVLVLALAVVVVQATSRNVPKDAAGLDDQKNFLTYGGVGGYSGIGADGMPIGGVGSAGGTTGLDGTGGTGGISGVGFGNGDDSGAGGGVVGGTGGSAPGVIHFP
ncbi:hypothetical protein F3Y22_tig00111338pilonHSYRG00169 [Hibiscus syriacus]|uniref:RNase H type-1 domain-containing protein n=2 Tax=Hibiscus syriacus TaxID=106335 RepID=A0A6A2YPF1_HIBSY|nr:hypothetical protein F3Y22_tig00111338pilonHSYRG00169 [Hibiscus syriacus]